MKNEKMKKLILIMVVATLSMSAQKKLTTAGTLSSASTPNTSKAVNYSASVLEYSKQVSLAMQSKKYDAAKVNELTKELNCALTQEQAKVLNSKLLTDRTKTCGSAAFPSAKLINDSDFKTYSEQSMAYVKFIGAK